MRIIAYQTSQQGDKAPVLLEETTGEFAISKDIQKLLEFLLEPYENAIKVCWDLDITVSLLLKLMPKAQLDKLRSTHKCHTPPFNIFYIHEKVFSIVHIPTKQRTSLYGLKRYYSTLDVAPTLTETQILGEKLMYELKKMGMIPTKLTSPIAIYDECVMSRLNLPTLKDMPLKAAELAYQCAGKLWIEAHQLGYWETVYDYDMISAFPTIAQCLQDFRECDWVESPDYQKDAIYGYTNSIVTIYDNVMISPIIVTTPEGNLISPTGTFPIVINKSKLDFINNWHIGKYKIVNGWWAIPRKKELSKPLHEPIRKLLSYKGRTEIQTMLAKGMSTGVYGKLGEERENEFGEHFNPCWFAEISTEASLQLAAFLYCHDIGANNNDGYKTLLQIGVDGVKLTKPIENISDKWKLSYQGETLIASSGLVYTQTTKPKGLRLSDIKRMITDKPRASYYQKPVRRRVTLGDNIAKTDVSLIGTEINFQSSINLIDPRHDRVFKRLPKTGSQLIKNKYFSEPIKMTGGDSV